MQRSVKDHQAEAYEIYEIYEIAQEFSKSKDARTDLEGIVGKDATIHSMSKIIVNMTVMVQMQNAVCLCLSLVSFMATKFADNSLISDACSSQASPCCSRSCT